MKPPGTRLGFGTSSRSLLASFFLAGASACDQAAPPKSVRVEVPETILSTDPVSVIVRVRSVDGAERVNHKGNEFAVEPTSAAKVDGSGMLTCLRSVDASVTATVRGVSSRASFKCRLVDKINVPDLGQKDIADGPIGVTVQATTKDEKVLLDVPVSLTTPNSRVVRVQGATLVPLAVGKAQVHARAGNATATFAVDVVRRIKPDPVALNEGKQIHLSLGEGKYELVVELASDHKLNMEWRGAPYCDYKGAPNKVHRVTCVLRVKGAVVFDNPAYLGSGSKEASLAGIRISEVP